MIIIEFGIDSIDHLPLRLLQILLPIQVGLIDLNPFVLALMISFQSYLNSEVNYKSTRG